MPHREDVVLLWIFMENIKYYEDGIIDIIKYYISIYTFKSNEELKKAVKLWDFNKEKCIEQYGHISYWDTSKITDMSNLFYNYKYFNQDLSFWNTRQVKDMNRMFSGATNFNQPIGSWDTSNVTDMESMFHIAISFNQPIGSWDTSKVINMKNMFRRATSFNKDISRWDTCKVKDMRYLFNRANYFNQDISSWVTSNVIYVNNNIFYSCRIRKEYKPEFN